MRKYMTMVAVAVGLLAGAGAASAQDSPRFAYINSDAIIAQAPGAREAQQAFEKEMTAYKAELEGLENELKALMTEYEQKQVMLSPEAKRQRQEELQQKQAAYQQRAMELEQTAAQRQAELVQPIMERINTVIGAIRQEGAYAMIFDVAEGGVVAADPSLDLTSQVLERLKAQQTTAAKQP